MLSSPHSNATIFSVNVRWAMRVLAWLAFLITSYLAWHAMREEAVAGCTAGSGAGCDMVLSSSWSRWINLPVSVAGLGCYSALAVCTSLIGFTRPQVSRWIDTAVVMLSILAAGASIWFLALQAIAIGEFCPYCIVVDVTGIALGALAVWSVVNNRSSTNSRQSPGAGVMALRATMPGVPRVTPLKVSQSPLGPSITAALGGAALLLCVLIVGQVAFRKPVHELRTVALDMPINMTSANGIDTTSSDVSPDAQTHVAMRVDADSKAEDGDSQVEPGDSTATSNGADSEEASNDSETTTDEKPKPAVAKSEPAEAPQPKGRSRLVKFLGGKLTLDTYQYPILGDPEAPHVMVELLSYDCPHCRKMHSTMQRGLRRYGNQMAILVLPVPMETKCNPLITDPKASHTGACTTARMSLAVARIKPGAFRSFHDFLMEDEEKVPTQAKSVGKAYSMVDSVKLRKLTNGDDLNKQVAKIVELFGTLMKQNSGNKQFGLPIQIMGDEVMSGSVEDAEDVYKAWEKNLNLKPQ